MAAIYAMLVADALFVGFLLLTRLESARGTRYFEGRRERLDFHARKAEFIFQHVDWGALIRDTTRTNLDAFAHEAATRSLLLVRSTERFLTQAVQVLGMRRAGLLPESDESDALAKTAGIRTRSRIAAGMSETRRRMNVNAERLKHGMGSRKVRVSEEEK